MRRLIKYIIINLSNYFPFVKNVVDNNPYIKVPIGLLLLNFITQRIFRLNSKVSFSVNYTSRINIFENISLKKDKVTLLSFCSSGGVYMQAANGIIIGKNFLFAPGVKLISANHDFNDRACSVKGKPIYIGDNVWIGTNAIILPEVKLGNNCIVGAGSVVTKSFSDDNSIIVGNPAKLIGYKPSPCY